MATVLRLYREALYEVGIRRHMGRAGDVQSAKEILDDITYNAVLAYCLEQGQWNFATRRLSISSTTTPTFGYSFQFTKPTDWVRTTMLSPTGDFAFPLEDYVDMTASSVGVWQANVNPIFVAYVSDDTNFGMNIALWPESYTRFVELELAWRIAPRTELNGVQLVALEEKLKRAKSGAMGKDAMNEAAPQRPQPGRFVRSRFGMSGRRIDPLIP